MCERHLRIVYRHCYITKDVESHLRSNIEELAVLANVQVGEDGYFCLSSPNPPENSHW